MAGNPSRHNALQSKEIIDRDNGITSNVRERRAVVCGTRPASARAIKVALIVVVFVLAGLLVAQRTYRLGDQSSACASRAVHATAGIPRCRP